MGLLDRFLAPWRRSAPAAGLVAAEPLLDLPLQAPFTEALPARREVATEAVREARAQEAYVLSGALLDPELQQFRRLTNGVKAHHRDLSPLGQERALEISHFLWEQNPLAKRLIGLMTDMVIGGGLTVEAEDERLQQVLDATWSNQTNQLQTRAREFYTAQMLTGELFITNAVNPVSGAVIFGYLDPAEIDHVVPSPGNILQPMAVRLKPDAMTGTEGKLLTIVQENPATGLLEGEVFYHGINKLPNSLRGRPDLLAFADSIDQFDQFLLTFGEQAYLQSSFVYDLKMTGADEKAIQDRLAKFPTPRPGTVFAHNEKEELEVQSPSLQAQDRSNAARMLLTHIVGTFGFPLTYFGFTDSNNATIQGQNDVMMRTPQARQQEYRAFIGQLVRYVLERATTTNPALFREAKTGFTVRMPEIQAKDVSRIGQVLAQVVTALDTAMTNGTASRSLAVTTLVSMLGQLGIEADPVDVMAQADAEAEERQAKADEIAAGVARGRARRNPPVPDPDDPDDDPDAEADARAA